MGRLARANGSFLGSVSGELAKGVECCEGKLAFRPFQLPFEITLRSGPPGSRMLPEHLSGRSAPYDGPEVNVASLWDDSLVQMEVSLAQ
jgi:hypothetical protein